MLQDTGPGLLVSALVIGTVGFAMLIYGKKAERPWFLGCGLVLCIFPYFVHSLLVLWLGTIGVCAASYGGSRLA